jgi:hypothetical protein
MTVWIWLLDVLNLSLFWVSCLTFWLRLFSGTEHIYIYIYEIVCMYVCCVAERRYSRRWKYNGFWPTIVIGSVTSISRNALNGYSSSIKESKRKFRDSNPGMFWLTFLRKVALNDTDCIHSKDEIKKIYIRKIFTNQILSIMKVPHGQKYSQYDLVIKREAVIEWGVSLNLVTVQNWKTSGFWLVVNISSFLPSPRRYSSEWALASWKICSRLTVWFLNNLVFIVWGY